MKRHVPPSNDKRDDLKEAIADLDAVSARVARLLAEKAGRDAADGPISDRIDETK